MNARCTWPLGLLALAELASAGTFERTAIAPDLGIEMVTRQVSRSRLERDLFAEPYATVVTGTIDVYDVFPYLEARYVQVVSDPGWNRLLYGEVGRSLRAYDGQGSATGRLSGPKGMAVDENGLVYVADSGNDRVVVLQVSTELGDVSLAAVRTIGGLSHPFDVAVSDAGTPFEAGDDRLYVADTGRNRVVAYALGASGPREVASVGALGGGAGRFAGPLAITVGRDEGRCTADVFVADAHNRRIVRLRDAGSELRWIDEHRVATGDVTSLDADQWGNLYAASPGDGSVCKLSADLTPVAELAGDLLRPRSFHVPFVTVRDHRDGRVVRSGRPQALLVEKWTDGTGLRLYRLGVETRDLRADASEGVRAEFMLTDRADITVELIDATSGRTVATRREAALDAGAHAIAIRDRDFTGPLPAGTHRLRVTARSGYADGGQHVAETLVSLAGAGPSLPAHPILLGAHPNPTRESAQIAFLVPEGGADARLRIFDARGRLVRAIERRGLDPGANALVWDGSTDSGEVAGAGIYFYRLEIDDLDLTDHVVLVR